jgi:hypothetical protein
MALVAALDKQEEIAFVAEQASLIVFYSSHRTLHRMQPVGHMWRMSTSAAARKLAVAPQTTSLHSFRKTADPQGFACHS